MGIKLQKFCILYPSALEVLLKYDGFTGSNLKLTMDLRNSDQISATVDIIKYS